MSSSSSTPLFMIIGALASLFSSLKIVQTRRRLQKDRNVPVSLVEAVVHSLFDAVDRVNVQANQIAMIMDERMNQSSSVPMLQLQFNQQYSKPKMLTSGSSNSSNNAIPSLTFSSPSISPSPSFIPPSNNINNINNNIKKNNNNQIPIIHQHSKQSNNNIESKLSDPMLASIPNNSFK